MLFIDTGQKKLKLLILRKIITGQKQASDPEPKRIIGLWSSPAPIHRSTCDGTLVVSVSLSEEIEPLCV